MVAEAIWMLGKLRDGLMTQRWKPCWMTSFKMPSVVFHPPIAESKSMLIKLLKYVMDLPSPRQVLAKTGHIGLPPIIMIGSEHIGQRHWTGQGLGLLTPIQRLGTSPFLMM